MKDAKQICLLDHFGQKHLINGSIIIQNNNMMCSRIVSFPYLYYNMYHFTYIFSFQMPLDEGKFRNPLYENNHPHPIVV